MRRRASLAAFAVLAEVVAGERRGAAAVQVDSTLQESVFDQAGLDSPNLTIGDGPARLLVVAVATGNPAAVVRHITWSGAALTRLDARVLAAPAGPCRLELWTLIDPASGASSLQVSLSASAGFGLGAVVYTGVDAEEPLGPARWQSGSGGRIALDVPAPGERPVLGAACLGGHWNGGPTASTPEAEPGPGETDFWNFTEPGVVGLGSHRVTMNGQARVSWNVTGSEPYQWLAMGISIKPLGEVLPDAGPDGMGGAPDAAPEPADGPAERGMAAEALPGPLGAEGESAEAGVADVHLRVGCACDTGRRGTADAGFLLVALATLTVGRRRRHP